MQIIRKAKKIQELMTKLKRQNQSIGFVATMGYLHEGHLRLIEEAGENDVVVASIFVNPLQFGPGEDYDSYPRNEEMDIEKAREAGVNYLFVPDVVEMYPNEPVIQMQITERVNVLCGKSRPGHFDGVLMVLTKLFHLVQPDRAYFGSKDAQQVAVVEALVNELNFPVELVSVPTVREADGLAKSSRNVRLSKEEREDAVWLYQSLLAGKKVITEGETNPAVIVKHVQSILEEKTSGEIDYVELLSYPELKVIQEINRQVILAVAVHFENARLIDNLLIDPVKGRGGSNDVSHHDEK